MNRKDGLTFFPLQKMDSTPVPHRLGEIRLFSVVRNEELRLPYFWEDYSRLGVDRFFFVDNASQDGSPDFLQSRPKTHLFHTPGSYREAGYGIHWIQSLLDKYGEGHWSVVADADELLYYPYCEILGLQELCAILDEEGAGAMPGVLLEMYSKKPIRLTSYKKGEGFLAVASYFDKFFYHGKSSKLSWGDRPHHSAALASGFLRAIIVCKNFLF